MIFASIKIELTISGDGLNSEVACLEEVRRKIDEVLPGAGNTTVSSVTVQYQR